MFASHRKSLFWSGKNTIKPDKVALGSSKKYWFDCDTIGCGHDFEQSPEKISNHQIKNLYLIVQIAGLNTSLD
jgi:hypothetical protein